MRLLNNTKYESTAILGDSLFCMEKDDFRLQPMCCHYLSDAPCNDILLGAEECTSPFGTYQLSMPIDDQASCGSGDSPITDKNCKDFDVRFLIVLTCKYFMDMQHVLPIATL